MAWFGFDDEGIHRRARQVLGAQPGERVVVVGGGTGIDVVPVAQSVGAEGRVWSVDVSQGMLEVCRRRCEQAGLDVEHVHADAATWNWPACDAVLCSFTLLFQPRWQEVLAQAAEALRPGGRLVFCDLELPWGLRMLAWPLVAHFGHRPRTLARRPARVLADWDVVADERRFFGMVRILAATPPQRLRTPGPAGI